VVEALGNLPTHSMSQYSYHLPHVSHVFFMNLKSMFMIFHSVHEEHVGNLEIHQKLQDLRTIEEIVPPLNLLFND
jgi:hypothetical protein